MRWGYVYGCLYIIYAVMILTMDESDIYFSIFYVILLKIILGSLEWGWEMTCNVRAINGWPMASTILVLSRSS